MSVCLESNSSSVVLPAQAVGNNKPDDGASTTTAAATISKPKIINANANAQPTDLSTKVNANASVITVVKAPITVAKSIGVAPPANQSSTTITLMNAVPPPAKSELTNNGNNLSIAPVNDRQSAIHNVFVKKSAPAEGGGISVPDMPQSHKLLTANSFPPTNILQKLTPANGQRPPSKVKILSHLVVHTQEQPVAPQHTITTANAAMSPGPSNVILNKNQRFFQPQKIVGNGASKYLNKSPIEGASGKRLVYPLHKNLKAMAPGYKGAPPPLDLKMQQHQQQLQRPPTGLKTLPPQRHLPVANKTNYIGKHAVQAQKMKPKMKQKLLATGMHHPQQQQQQPPGAVPQLTSPVRPDQTAQTIFNQALTAQILETLSDKESGKLMANAYAKYEPCLSKPEVALPMQRDQMETREFRPRSLSTLDTLSFVCQAVLLDHNYNATLPSEPPKPPTVVQPAPPVNGAQHHHQQAQQQHAHALQHQHQPHAQFAPMPSYPTNLSMNLPAVKRNRTTSQTQSQSAPLPVAVLPPQREQHVHEDDAASDISEAKADTEGEETDTAPEAEAVTNEANDRYGDYVTRCICGFIHDDGFMIECDKCKVWQHVRCVVKTKKVPEDFLCEECDPRTVDRQKARALQQQWMREIQERDAKLRKEQMALTDSDSSDGEAHKNRRKEPPPRRQRRDSLTKNPAKPGKRKERKVPTKRAAAAAKPKPGKSDDEKLPLIRQWIDNYEEAVTNHYSPELRARISSVRLNGAHSEIAGGVEPSVNKCRVQANPATSVKCLVASVSLPMGTPVIELRGKYMLSTQHRSTTRQQRPGPFLFFHTLVKDTEVCVDTRTYGNCARFVRRSCTPNAKLQHVLEKGTLHLYVVTTKSVEKGSELTIRHENHELAASMLAEVPCACINPEYCSLLKGHRRHNGEAIHPPAPSAPETRKRRGRQSREAITSPLPPQPPPPEVDPPAEVKEDDTVKTEKVDDVKVEIKEEPDVKVKVEELEVLEPKAEDVVDAPEDKKVKTEKEEPILEQEQIKKEDVEEEPPVVEVKVKEVEVKPVIKEEEVEPAPPVKERQARISTRRASRHSQEHHEVATVTTTNENEKKPMSREERKMAAIVKAIERLEKQEQRRQEHQAKQATRRESEPSVKDEGPKIKRRKRKGRARTTSTNTRRNRLDSADSVHSSDDTLLSPPLEAVPPTKAAGLLLALANGECRKSPDRQDSSNSAHSSPETPLSAACLMVAAAVEPLEPGFKFPKTKKVLMNEWLNKSDGVQPASAISPSSLTPHIDGSTIFAPTTPAKCLSALAQVASFAACDQPRSGSAKKRWLRQAISEDQCDSPPQADAVAPPKKRKLPRESLSSEPSPPSTPTASVPPQVEIVTPVDEDESTPMESEATLNELATEMRQEYGSCLPSKIPERVERECEQRVERPETPPAPPEPEPEPEPEIKPESEPEVEPEAEHEPESAEDDDDDDVEPAAGDFGGEETRTISIVKEGDNEDENEVENEPENEAEDAEAMEVAPETPPSPSSPVSAPILREPSPLPPVIATVPPPPTLLPLPIPAPIPVVTPAPTITRAIMDPRLAPRISTSDLVGTVEKTLTFLGLQDKKPEAITPTRRKLSINEYRQRKKLNNNEKSSANDDASITEESNSTQSPKLMRERSNSSSSTVSTASSEFTTSDDEKEAQMNQTVPVEVKALSAFNSEPTELERQRENAALRLKRALGLALDKTPKNPPILNVETILKVELPVPPKTSLSLSLASPSFPIPGTAEPLLAASAPPVLEKSSSEEASNSSPPQLEPETTPEYNQPETRTKTTYEAIDEDTQDCEPQLVKEVVAIEQEDTIEEDDDDDEDTETSYPSDERKVLFYTPDDEEVADSATYVPPFNNPLYPNISYASYGSVIDDDAPYEGRNPSPPPDLSAHSSP